MPTNATRGERVGVIASLAVFILGLTDLIGGIELAPIGLYLGILWVIALGLWLHRRRS